MGEVAANSFSNGQQDVASLPDADLVDYHPLDPSYIRVSAGLTALLIGLPVLLGPLIAFLLSGRSLLLGVSAAGAVLSILFGIFLYREGLRRGYAVRAHDIIFRKGLIFQSQVVVPFARLQHAEIHRGPIARAVGCATLKLFTAGAGEADLTMPGLPVDVARRIKEMVLRALDD